MRPSSSDAGEGLNGPSSASLPLLAAVRGVLLRVEDLLSTSNRRRFKRIMAALHAEDPTR